jgi:DNA-binding CsgD family transcriptional regulator
MITGRVRRALAELTAAGAATIRLMPLTASAAAGYTNGRIADRLSVSPHTVNTHLRHAFDKLDIRSRVDLTRIVERRRRIGG